VLPISGHEKAADKKADACTSGEAPLPSHWCGNNWHRDEEQQDGPKPGHEADRQPVFAMMAGSLPAQQADGQPRKPLAPSLRVVLVGERSKIVATRKLSRPWLH
jgi:hypothetical protein